MKKLFELLSTLALIVVLLLAGLLVGVRVVGLTPYSVLSGSMEPEYSVGDLIYVKPIDPKDIEIGMPVTYVANEDLVIATHRVIDITERTTTREPVMLDSGKAAMDKNGNVIMQEVPLDEPVRYFLTKGDANPVEDMQAVHERNIIGTPVYAVPHLGYFVTLLQTDAGKIMGLSFGLMLVILMFLPEMLRAVEKGDKKPGAEAADHNNEETAAEEAGNDEDPIVCGEETGDDLLIPEEGAAQGEDRILCTSAQGEDVVKIDEAR